MALKPLRDKARERRFKTYDLEWTPGKNPQKARAIGLEPMQLRLAGVYDGKKYNCYTSIKDFLNGECTNKNSGMWFYAHAGGLYDVVFILNYLVDNPNPNIKVSCSFSGSSAIIVKIKKGKHCWYFLDSFWLIRQSLRQIGKWVGEDKGGEQGKTDIFYAPLSILMEYNRRDCEILFKAIKIVEETVMSLGGCLEMTIASTALSLFRRVFLKEEITTNQEINKIAREAYIASRVEVFNLHCHNSDYYDINSSFPYAMTFEAPGNVKSSSKRYRPDSISLVKATINIKQSNIPPIPYRNGEERRIYFPTGKWSGWFSNVDINLIEESGNTIDNIEECIEFYPFNDLKDYAQTIYELRKKSDDEAFKVVLKFLLNSLYGKFAEGEIKSKYYLNPDLDIMELPDYDGPGTTGKSYVMPGIYEVVEQRTIPHAHVPIAVHITSIARANLYRYLIKPPTVNYCDTDGLSVPNHFKFDTSNELGGLKYEKPMFEARFIAPKLYAYREKDNSDWVIKAKGFSRIVKTDELGNTASAPLNYQDFCQLLEKKEVHIEQFARIRTLAKSGNTTPRDVDHSKTLRGTVRPKRSFYPDGSSRPWTIEEILPQ